MLWWHSWSWYFGAYQWLELNNLWKAVVAFFVTLLISVTLTAIMRPWRAWRHHRDIQDKIADRLDTSTPGGLADLMHALSDLLEQLDEGETPDDNGSDALDRRRSRNSRAESGRLPRTGIGHIDIKGGSSHGGKG